MTSWGERHTVVVLCFLMGALNYSLRFNLSIGIVAMTDINIKPQVRKSPTANHLTEMCPTSLVSVSETANLSRLMLENLPHNHSRIDIELHKNEIVTFAWNEKDQGLILGSFYWGYVCSQIPGGLLSRRYGAKWVIAIAMLGAGILSVGLPHAAFFGGRDLVIGVRILQGFFEGFMVPALVNLKGKWFPPQERARLSAVCTAGFPFGSTVTMLFSGHFITAFGWPAVFYIPGVLTVLCFFLWIWKLHSSPEDHPNITVEELNCIKSSITLNPKRDSCPDPKVKNGVEVAAKKFDTNLWEVPWKNIACSIPVWVVFIGQFSNAWGHNMIKSMGPKYLNSALHFDIHQNSYIAACPHLLQMIFAILFSRLSDFLLERKLISMLNARKLCNSVGQWGIALAFLGIIIAGCNRTPAVACYIASGIVGGAVIGGTYVNIIDISPNYAGVIEGVINTFSSVTGFVAPYLAGLILNHEPSILGWRYVFMVPVITNLVGNLVFVIGAKADVQWWNDKPMPKTNVEMDEK